MLISSFLNRQHPETFPTVRHLADAGVADHDGRVQFLVRVAADNHVYFRDLACDFKIVVLSSGIHPNVREADNQVAVPGFKLGYHLAGDLHRVAVGDLAGDARGHVAVKVHPEAEYADLVAAALNDDVGFDDLGQFLVGELVVGAHHREVGGLEAGGERGTAVVELVVSERGRVVTHGIHQPHLHVALEEVEIGRSLREVAGINQQRVRILRTHLADGRFPAQKTAYIHVSLVRIGVNLAVRVVRVHDDQRLRRGRRNH